MAKVFEGKLLGAGLKFGVVIARFNEFIGDKLLDGARDAFARHGVELENIDVAWTPGSFEVPLIAQKLAKKGGYDAIICLGAIIRGGTPHFEYVASELSKGIARVALDAGIPVINGVITAESLEQAIERAGTKMGNKGFDAAVAAIEMANLVKSLSQPKAPRGRRPRQKAIPA
jgi:6,7-dimethyl-8-ribityllumazine synthase